MRKHAIAALMLAVTTSVVALAAPVAANASTTPTAVCKVGGGWPTVTHPTC